MASTATPVTDLFSLFGRWLIEAGQTVVITALYAFIASAVLFLPLGFREIQTDPRHRGVAALVVGSGLFT